MKKQFINTVIKLGLPAMALLSAPAFAQTNVTVYGMVDVFLGPVQTPGVKKAFVEQGGGLSTSYVGFAGSEQIDADLKAIFTLESYLQTDTGALGNFPGDVLFSRNAFVGLSSRTYGTIKLGRLAPHLFAQAVKFNPFANSFNFSPIILQTYRTLGAQGVIGATDWNNAVSYLSPSFGGFAVGGIHSFGEDPDDASTRKESLLLSYDHGPLSTAAVYQYANYNSVAGDIATAIPAIPGLTSQSVFQLDASYDFTQLELYAQYMYTQDSARIEGQHVDTGQLGVSIPVGTDAVLASYAYSKASTDDRRKTFAVGYDHPLSKRTELYALFKSDRFTGISEGNSLGFGMRTKF